MPAADSSCLLAHLPASQVQFNVPAYSRGIRQRLANASAQHGWLEKHNIAVGE